MKVIGKIEKVVTKKVYSVRCCICGGIDEADIRDDILNEAEAADFFSMWGWKLAKSKQYQVTGSMCRYCVDLDDDLEDE